MDELHDLCALHIILHKDDFGEDVATDAQQVLLVKLF